MTFPNFAYASTNADHLLLFDALGSPCARRVRISLLEKGKAWDSLWIDLSTLQQRHPDYLAINPNGFVPSFAHGDRIIYESGVITAYLDDLLTDVPLYPADPDQFAQVKKWQASELSMAKDFRTLMYTRMMGPVIRLTRTLDEALQIAKRSTTSPWDLAWEERIWKLQILTSKEEQDYEDRLLGWLDHVETGLVGRRYLVGDVFSQADIAVYPRVEMYSYIGLKLDGARFPNVVAWKRRLAQRPSFQKSLTPLDNKLKALTGTGILRWAKRALQKSEGPNALEKMVTTSVGAALRKIMGVDKQVRDWQQASDPIPAPSSPKITIQNFERASLNQSKRNPIGPIKLLGDKRSAHTRRIMLALEILGLGYEFDAVDMATMEHKGSAFLALNPNGEVPAAIIGDQTLFDSELILDYLDRHQDHAAKLIPRDAFEAAQMRMWIALEQGTHKEFRPLFYLHTIRPTLLKDVTSRTQAQARVPTDAHPSFRDWIGDVYDGTIRFDSNESYAKAQILSKLSRLEAHLAGRAFLVGDTLSFADLAWYSRVNHVSDYGMTLNAQVFPQIIRWCQGVSGALSQYEANKS